MKHHRRSARAAFTLIELLAVITIIIILAALVVGGMKYAQDRQAIDKTRVQLARISSALENYKLDTGTYPETSNTGTGQGQSNLLFLRLYDDGAKDSTGATKIYIAEFDPNNKKLAWVTGTGATVRVVDAWGNEIRYRSEKSGASINNSTLNPGFDLWSVGKDGTSQSDGSTANPGDDITNP